MIPFYFFGFIMIFIVIPQNTHSIFLEPVQDIIAATGNLTCYSDSTDTSSDYDLCAIRVYASNNAVAASTNVTVWDGMWFTNTFRQFIETRNCTGFNDSSDIGSGTCDLMPYEIANTMTLCICATDGCNENLETCEESIQKNQNFPVLPTIISNLATIIKCNDNLDNSFTCSSNVQITSFIDATACKTYVTTHSVLCTIIEDDSRGATTQQALIEENYQNYLTGRLHTLKLTAQLIELNDTNASTYVEYFIGEVTDEECVCTENSFCNNNISTCAANIGQTETTTPMEFSSSFFRDSTSESAIATDFTAAEPTIATTSTTAESAIAIDSITAESTIVTTSTTAESAIITTSTTAESAIVTDFTTVESTIVTTSTTAESAIATDFTTAESTIVTTSTTAESAIITTSTTAESAIVTTSTMAESTIVTTSTTAGSEIAIDFTTAESTIVTTSTTAESAIATDFTTAESTIVTTSTTAGSAIATDFTTAESTIVTASTMIGSTIVTTSINTTATTESITATSMANVTSSDAGSKL